MPSGCRRNLEGLIAAVSMLAFLITLFNLVVLCSNLASGTRVLRKRNPTLLNYSNYVISMAIADLITGTIDLMTSWSRQLTNLLIITWFGKYFNKIQRTIYIFDVPHWQLLTQVDLITGLVVLPLALFFMYQELVHESALVVSNTTLSDDSHIGYSDSKFYYLMNTVGMFSHLAIFTSIYTLAAASADRFYTSCKPIPQGSLKLSSE